MYVWVWVWVYIYVCIHLFTCLSPISSSPPHIPHIPTIPTGGTRTLTAKIPIQRGPAGAKPKKGGAAGGEEKKEDEYQVALQMVGCVRAVCM